VFFSLQHLLFYPVMMVARFNLYIQSWTLLLSSAGKEMHYRKTEAVSLALYAAWVTAVALSMPSWLETAGWVLISHAVTALLHVQITISHWAMETYHGRGYNDASDEWCVAQHILYLSLLYCILYLSSILYISTISHWAMETYHGCWYNDSSDEWCVA